MKKGFFRILCHLIKSDFFVFFSLFCLILLNGFFRNFWENLDGSYRRFDCLLCCSCHRGMTCYDGRSLWKMIALIVILSVGVVLGRGFWGGLVLCSTFLFRGNLEGLGGLGWIGVVCICVILIYGHLWEVFACIFWTFVRRFGRFGRLGGVFFRGLGWFGRLFCCSSLRIVGLGSLNLWPFGIYFIYLLGVFIFVLITINISLNRDRENNFYFFICFLLKINIVKMWNCF